VTRLNNPPGHGPDTFKDWAALGDSYASGVGAGTIYPQVTSHAPSDQRSTPGLRTAIYQQSYPQFFDDYTTGCNNQTFMPGLQEPLITTEL
jgi:hypothetical protein